MPIFPQFDRKFSTDREKDVKVIFGLSNEQLIEILKGYRLDTYRIRQIFKAVYQQRVSSLQEITVLPQVLRLQLAESGFTVGLPEIARAFQSSDGTERYLIACSDGETVETVWMPNGDDGELGDGSDAADESAERYTANQAQSKQDSIRATICVSSQAGCAVNCRFCLTAALGIKRNLSAGEIAGQVVAVLNRHRVRIGRDRINLVFMGMGEPFLNYDNFMAAVHLLVEGVGIPESRMTVSTSGILPGIERFANEKIRPKLALSLNAPNDKIRERIMPITRKWRIAELLAALKSIPLRRRERLTFEYVLLGGINDRIEHAQELAGLVRGPRLPVKVNLIVWNPGPGIPYRSPSSEDVSAFQQHLISNGIPAFLRRPRGRDIFAACGQLKRTLE